MSFRSLGIRSHLLLTVIAIVGVGFGVMYVVAGQLVETTLLESQRRGAASLAARIADDLAISELSPEVWTAQLERWSGVLPGGCVGLVDSRGAWLGDAGLALERCGATGAEVEAIRRDPGATRWLSGDQGPLVVVGASVPTAGDAGAPGGGAVLVYAERLTDTTARISAVRTLILLFLGLAIGLVMLLGYALLTRLVIRPLERLGRAIGRVAEGELEVRAAPMGGRELRELATSFNSMTLKLRDDEARIARQIRELERMNARLETATESLLRSEKLASVGRLAAGVAHEIGNPISIVLGYLEMLGRADVSDEERSFFLSQCSESTQRISAIIRDLLDFSRPERDSDGEPTADIRRAVAQSVALMEPQKAFKRIRLRVTDRTDPAESLVAAICEQRLVQVLVNLLMNAADAVLSEQDAGDPRIELEIEPGEAGRLVVRVSDNGPGIEPSVRRRLFDPFFTTKEPGKGTGLGLSICYSILTSRGGDITLESKPGAGATFIVELLPVGYTPEQVQADPATAEAHPGG